MKTFCQSKKNIGFSETLKIYNNIPQIIRGYSTIEMQLVRSICIESGYNKLLSRKVFEILYTKIIFNSLQDYYKKNNYVNNERFREYLLVIYFSNVRTKINGTIYSNMTKYLGEDVSNWTKNKFYIACLGLPYQTFTKHYIFDTHQNIIIKYSLDTKFIETELERIGNIEQKYYGADKVHNILI